MKKKILFLTLIIMSTLTLKALAYDCTCSHLSWFIVYQSSDSRCRIGSGKAHLHVQNYETGKSLLIEIEGSEAADICINN